MPPLSLYLHFPWCVRKCPYCDFNSHRLRGELPENEYIDALIADVTRQAQSVPGLAARPIVSVFMGGGTPSLFGPPALARLLERLHGVLAFAPGAEITMEANPGTIERGRFTDYRAAGINRVSLGVQSFDDAQLKVLGRIHSANDAIRAAEELHAAGLINFNLDLMYALPGQSIEGALRDIDAALALHPQHLSHYQLTIEPNTAFAATPPVLPEDDAAWDMQLACQSRLAAAGFAQYEVSAYARPGRRCVHNLNYWRFGDYLGAGAGAHGKLSESDAEGRVARIVRTRHARDPRRYAPGAPAGAAGEVSNTTREPVSPDELPFEFMLNALRLVDGFAEADFVAHTGLSTQAVEPTLRELAQRGLLTTDTAGCWRATELGFRFLNDVVGRFVMHSGKVPSANLGTYVSIV